ncbi:S8 family serine peptidase [Paenibacillus sp. LMG 31459]|uniref:S8 family serine peptidase n=1 Tax=Paenibacillus phytohabitans TaxID=2654978 RepID=A0ABX1YPL5_9BACL|nr:S8 family serine peptidase [Paenibacillus phytohabitans]NOU82897.1 S8 family serine peptidase [Paenibacillus phytohabitans]
MRKEWLSKSVMIMAFTSLLIGPLGNAFAAQEPSGKTRKSEWSADTAPQAKVVQIKPSAGSSAAGAETKAIPAGEAAYDSSTIIVKYKAGFTSPSSSILDSGILQSSIKLSGIHAEALSVPASADIGPLITELNKDPNVLYAEPDYKLYPAAAGTLPDDTYFDRQWALLNTGQDPANTDQPGLPGIDIKATEAWNITQGSSDLIVAVIDTGMAAGHPDLADNIWTNKKDYADNGKDDDNNGYIDDVHGWNFIDQSNQLYDAVDGDWHGTAVAGIIAASSNNGIGVSGIAPKVKIMPLKFMKGEYGTVLALIEAIQYAEKNGAKIANISAETYSYSQALKDVIDASKMLIVAPSGNYSVNTDATPAYPAAFDSPNILSVTAVDNTGNLASMSNIGAESVDVAAPGDLNWTTAPVVNAGLAAQIDDGTSKIIFNGIAFENILDDEDADQNYRQEAFDKAMDYLGAPKDDASARILLVQDDGSNIEPYPSTPKLSKYTDLLEDYTGFDEAVDIVQTAPNGGDGPSAELMQQYDVVIWFTGTAARNNLKNITDNDQAGLKEYLQAGGNLLLTGSHSLNAMEESDFTSDVLHLYFVEEYFYSNVLGVSGTIYDGVRYPLDEDKDSYNWVISRDPKIAAINLENITKAPNSTYTYNYTQGTSYAAAHASGVAALVLSQEPSLSPLAVKQRIMSSGTRLSSLTGRIASGAMINAYQALTDDDIPGTPYAGSSITNRLDEAADVNDVYSIELHAGENISLALTGDAGTDFDLYLYSPEAATVQLNDNILAYSENKGTSSEAIDFTVNESGTYYLDVYAYKGSGSYTLGVATDNLAGSYEDTSSPLIFTGPWAQVSSSAYSGTIATQINAKGKVEFAFVGSYISWTGSKNDKQGIANVYIDGIKAASPSLFSKTSLDKQLIYEKIVPYGQHTFTIEWTGKTDSNAKKSGTAFINVDALTVAHLIQEDNATTSYSGAWKTNFSLKHFGGIAKYADGPEAYAQFKFEGTQVQVLAYTGPNRGIADILIDDKPVASVDLYSAVPQFRAVIFEAAALPAGKHTLRVVHTGEKNTASSGTYISVDAISIPQ